MELIRKIKSAEAQVQQIVEQAKNGVNTTLLILQGLLK
jgi:vacuolar-type H+-ATPase subunit H